MKNYKSLGQLLLLLSLPIIIASCDSDDDGPEAIKPDFASISSNYSEANGTGTVTIPFRGAIGSDVTFVYSGTATEGEDYEVIGVTGEGLQISVIDDNEYEVIETISVQMVSPSGNLNGNTVHDIAILSNCEDTENMDPGYFGGSYAAVEDYTSSTYGPYDITLVQDETDPNTFHFDNLYDSGCDAYMVFDLEAGTVHFPDQSPCGVPLTNSSGTFVYDVCADMAELTINLNFDGGDWIYRFSKN